MQPARTFDRLAPLARKPALVLGLLVVAQWASVAAFGLTVPRNGLLFYHGGDETFFWTTSWILSEGRIPLTEIGYAWSLLLAPLALVAGPDFLAGLPAVLALQFFVLLPVALLALYGIAERIGGRLLGYAGAALWVALPWLAMPLFVDRYDPQLVHQFLPQALGLSALGDFPSMVALLVATYFVFRALDVGDAVSGALAGVATGFAIGIKPSNALFLAAPWLAFVLARRWREGLAFGVALLPAVVTLAVWKSRGLGHVPLLAYEEARIAASAFVPSLQSFPLVDRVGDYLVLDWDRLRAVFRGIEEFFWSVRLIEYLPLAGVIAVGRRSVPKAAFLAAWLALFFLFKGSSSEASVESGSFWRLFLPAFPALFLLMLSLPLLVPTFGPRLAERFTVHARRIPARSVPVAAAVLIFAALPLAATAALPVLDRPLGVKRFEEKLYVSVDLAWQPHADVAADGAVRLDWPARPAGSAEEVHYRVFRAPYEHPGRGQHLPPTVEGIQCLGEGPGAPDCSLEMDTVTNTPATESADAPGPGRWSYRVGVVAGWSRNPDQGDLLVVSAPVTVDVPAAG